MCFCHLHLHTEYSLLDGVSKIRPLLEKVKESGMDSCAITDHGVMYGAFEFWSAAKEYNIKPILGCEVYVAQNSRFERAINEDGKKYSHLTLLAKNQEGYHNLVRLVSLGHKEGFYYKPRVDRELLAKYSKGIICLTGCPGSAINQALLKNDQAGASDWMEFLGNEFDDIYFELMRSKIEELEGLEAKQIQFNQKYKLPFVATVDSHYIEPDDHKIQEIAWCIADGKLLTDPNRRQYGSQEFYLKTPQMMEELFKDIPEAVENTGKISELVEKYNVTFDRIQPKYYSIEKNKDTKEQLKELTYQKATERYPEVTDEIKERIDYELKIIDDKGYNDYFLVVQDYINWARANGILVGPGRGSGAGSVIAYILGIVNIDPLRWNLIFERFLNPERDSPPDFDIDFQDDRRDELFEYMTQKYGKENTSFIGTFGRLKTKAAIRDVARVMGIDLAMADKLSKMVIVKFGRVHSIDKMMAEVKEFADIVNGSSQLQELAGYVRKIENIARHVSTHACGYLVTPDPIIEYVPVQKESKGGDKIVTQVEGSAIEYLGLMKFDFLGLTNLTIIQNTLKQIYYNRDEEINIDEIPLDDKKTFELFKKGNTTGVFQFESDGMKKYLRDLEPTNIEDLIFLNAAYRPGPMQYIPSYILRKKGKEEVTYLDPTLKPILESTFGYAIYQEQVMEIAVKFAGYSLGQADMLRRAMGKKKPEIMAKEKEMFIERASKNGHSKKLAAEVFAYLEPFADYGFNRSHSACYSMIAYQTAYLKANYPLEFLAGMMQTNLGVADKIARDLEEARDMGIKVLPPDINESYADFKIEDNSAIRFGMGAIKNCGIRTMENIVAERKKTGKFENLDDLVTRVGVDKLTKKDLECLIKVGAMDSFGSRSQLIEVLPIVLTKAANDAKRLVGGQKGLFDLEEATTIKTFDLTPLPQIAKESDHDRLLWEKEMLGTFLSSHPLENYSDILCHNNIFSISAIQHAKAESQIKVLGMIVNRKTIYTKRSAEPMAFVQIEDINSRIEGVIFPKPYQRVMDQIKENTPLIFAGKVSIREGAYSLLIDDIIPIDKIDKPDGITINIVDETNSENLVKLKELITNNPGNTKLSIVYGTHYQPKTIIRQIKITPKIIEVLKIYQQN